MKTASQRRTIGYFSERKFGTEGVLEKLKEDGFSKGGYSKIIVTWGWTDEAANAATQENIFLWDFRDLISEIADTSQSRRQYFTDDTMRTLQLFALSVPRGS